MGKAGPHKDKKAILEKLKNKKALRTKLTDEEVGIKKAPPHEIKCSDGQVVSLKQARHWFVKKTKHLPDQEQRILAVHYTRYRRYLGKKGGSTHKAWAQRKILMDKYGPEILELYGKMFNSEEVQKAIDDLYGVEIGIGNLEKYRRKHVETISKKIEHHQNSHAELRLAHKKSRLQEYTELYVIMKEEFLKEPSPSTLNSLRDVLRAIRDEVDGDLVISGALNINLEHQIQAHFKTEVYKSANIQQLIISKVATRMNINPLMLMWSIENSYYHELDKGDPEDIDWEEVTYPSDETYDYESLEDKYEKRQKEKLDAASKVLKNTEVTEDMAKQFKDGLMKKLKGTKKAVKSKKDIMAAIKKVKEDSKDG